MNLCLDLENMCGITTKKTLPNYAGETSYWLSIVEFVQAEDYPAAYTETRRLLEIHPDDALLLRIQGICLLETGYLDEAVTVLTKALTLDSKSLACRYYLSQALAYRGSILESIKFVEEIISMAPDSEYATLAQPALKELYKPFRNSSCYPRWPKVEHLCPVSCGV